MIASYYNFCEYLRHRYPKDMRGVTLVPVKEFRQHIGIYLHVRDEQWKNEVMAMTMMGLAQREGDYILIAPPFRF